MESSSARGVERILEATDFLLARTKTRPRIGMILGTGLGDITAKLKSPNRVPYDEIPHFPHSTIQGHKGNLVFGKLGRKPVVVMEGRFHIYEGYTPQDITFPIRVMSRMGANVLLVSSAAGGLNPLFTSGDLMVVTDHINLTGMNPLIGPNLDLFGPRFPDMCRAYDRDLVTLIRRKALESRIPLREGIYTGILGPSLETPAETRFLRMVGADAVGMSTVLEIIAGVHCGMRCAAVVAITNVNLPDCMTMVSIEEVIEQASGAGTSLSRLWEAVLSSIEL
ncbi:MAG: purine-nucleoside phosphorylase [Desulfobacteraceae bacterium]|nr:MAG: purine-nucleoside phosphorylase [Desulfobacteraceae bacterium]